MFDNGMFNDGEKFGITKEALKKAERRVPIYAITNLTPEQEENIEDGNLIKVSSLTQDQLEMVNEALSFDYKYGRLSNETSIKVHAYL